MRMARIKVDGVDVWDIPECCVSFVTWWHSLFGEKISIVSRWEV